MILMQPIIKDIILSISDDVVSNLTQSFEKWNRREYRYRKEECGSCGEGSACRKVGERREQEEETAGCGI